MHRVSIPQAIRDRVTVRRGRLHSFEPIDHARTALLVVDMQRAFVDPGAPVEAPAARGIIPNINRLAAAAQAAGVPVVWIYMTAWERDGQTSWPVFYDHLATQEFGTRHRAALTAGAPLHGLADGLAPAPGDLHVKKERFSAFVPGTCDLDESLRARGIDTLIITGTLTNRCCETTARDAMMIGYKVILVEDATAALSDEEHLASLINVLTGFGDVRPTPEVERLLASR